MPTVSGNVGAVFNGGTISNALTISPAAAAVPLTIDAAAGAGALFTPLVQVVDEHGNVILAADAAGDISAALYAANAGNFTVAVGADTPLEVSKTGITLASFGGHELQVQDDGGNAVVRVAATSKVAFFGTAPAVQPTVTGSKGANAALTSLCTALAALGLIVNNTT